MATAYERLAKKVHDLAKEARHEHYSDPYDRHLELLQGRLEVLSRSIKEGWQA
jgi:hypothetical protein